MGEWKVVYLDELYYSSTIRWGKMDTNNTLKINYMLKAVKDLIYPGFTIVTGYSFTPKVSHLDMGCKKNVPVEDIHPLIEYWEKNFKE